MKTIDNEIKTDKLLLRQFVDSDIGDEFKGLSHLNIIKPYGISFDSLEATKNK